MITTTFVMFVENQIDVIRVHVAALSCAWLTQCLAYLIAKLVIDPLFDRYSEPLLRSIKNF